MEMQELKEIWNQHDKQLEKSIRLNTEVLKELKLGQVRSRTHRTGIGNIVEIVFSAIVIVLLGSFLADHFGDWKFFIPALVLDAAAIALLGSNIMQLIVLSQLDYGKPLVAIQKKLEFLRTLKIQTTKWIFTACVLIWTPLLIVGLKALFGVDAYASLGYAYLLSGVVLGLAIIAIVVSISKKYGTRIGGSRFVQSLMDDISGKNLNAARAHLRELQRFEQEN